jgi:hypothetical protein
MQKIIDRLDRIVRPALRDYAASERALNAAHDSKDQAAIDAARDDVMRKARCAANELHHLADFVNNPPLGTPSYPDVGPVRLLLNPHCVFLRTTILIDDVQLLRAVSEAFKHFHLDRPSALIKDTNSVIMLGSGWSEMRNGEGKYGGAEQVLVVLKTGEKRALSSILQNVFDAWLTLLGQSLPPFEGRHGRP